MQFRFVGTRPGAGLHPDGVSPIVFIKGRADRRVRIELGDVEGERQLKLRCEVVVDAPVKPSVAAAFERIEAGWMPEGSSPPDKPLGQLDASGEIRGRIVSLPLQLFPTGFQNFVAAIQQRLRDEADRATRLLRWRACEVGPQPTFATASYAWRRSDGTWESFPGGTGLSLDYVASFDVRSSAHDELQTLFGGGYAEPFAYELLREAWALRQTSPRTSLSVAITALEVAVKQFLAQRVAPEERAEITDTPGFDVLEALTGRAPTLPPATGSLPSASTLGPLPEELLELLERRRHQRNQLTHNPRPYLKPNGLPSRQHASDAVLAVRQVLLRLDIADGHLWAAHHLENLPLHAPTCGHVLVR